MGFEPPEEAEIAGLEPYFDRSFPYILYLGRKEMGKNAHLLMDYFCQAKGLGLINADTRLVILGGGSFSDLHRQDLLERGDIIDLPHLSERDKQRVIRHSLYLCQPSTNESFSIVLMEAWMLGTPVVVHGGCPVTKHHVMESAGGLYISSASDLGGVTSYLSHDSNIRSVFAARGLDYVKREFSWDAVLGRFDRVLEGMK
jgi:glycosyltransferase involved in cell wall biosynthesis